MAREEWVNELYRRVNEQIGICLEPSAYFENYPASRTASFHLRQFRRWLDELAPVETNVNSGSIATEE